jgi:predicted porin
MTVHDCGGRHPRRAETLRPTAIAADCPKVLLRPASARAKLRALLDHPSGICPSREPMLEPGAATHPPPRRCAGGPALVARVLAGVAATCLPLAGAAQSNVVLYGIADVAIEYSNPDANATDTTPGESGVRLVSGGHSASRLGVRGVEDLGGGLKAIFAFEHGLSLDTGDTSGAFTPPATLQFWNRQAWVGLDGAWGALTAGRQYTLLWDTLIATDASGFGFYQNVSQLFNNRVDNSVVYRSPSLAGFTGYAMVAFGEDLTAGGGDTDIWGVGMRWSVGAFLGGASYMRYGQASGPDRSEAGLGAAWKFSTTAQVGGGLIRSDRATGSEVDQYYVSGSIGALGGVVYLNYQYVDPEVGDTSNRLGVAYSLSLSRRTSWYLAFGTITDEPGGSTGTLDPMRVATGVRHLF